MSIRIFALLLAATAILGTACSKKDDAGQAATSGGGGGSIGIKECDDYVTKFEACFSKMDPITKSAAEPGFKAQRDGFKQSAQAATTPDAKAALANACKQSAAAIDSNPSCKK